ncbi:MAG TPA: hypothetical protein VJK06_04200, partial [Methyloceanibacter sp.]|nr:hypothetical protein [Methyloceanibacter sp.]
IGYPSGWGLWHWHGVRVPQWAIETPSRIKVGTIDSEKNAEVRRVLIERYGQARYLQDSGAQLVAEDEFGSLYLKEILDDEPIVMVKVKNSTPEPDGSVKDYFLRVPPNVRTPHQAVAWTFGQTPKTYLPLAQT